jgi:hypothetical protein
VGVDGWKWGDVRGGVVLIGREEEEGICDLKGDLETRLVLFSRLKVFDERRAIWEGCTCWDDGSRFAILRGDVGVVAMDDGGEDELQPRPDSRRMDDLTGSLTSGGVAVRRRSLRGVSWRGLGVVISDDDDDEGSVRSLFGLALGSSTIRAASCD